MPKDEFDFEDPFELNGVALLSPEDSTNDMAECFIEEFMRLGYNHRQILWLFRSRQFLGPNMAYEKRGEPFIRELIAEVFGRWGKPVTWPADPAADSPEPIRTPPSDVPAAAPGSPVLTDPLGEPIPQLNPDPSAL